MTTDRTELRNLRISLVRVAQAAGVSLASVGLAEDAGYEAIHTQAGERERGWNALAGIIIDSLEQRQ